MRRHRDGAAAAPAAARAATCWTCRCPTSTWCWAGSVGLNDVTVTFTDVRDRRPGLVSVEMSVPPDGEPGDLAVAGVLFRRHLEGQK